MSLSPFTIQTGNPWGSHRIRFSALSDEKPLYQPLISRGKPASFIRPSSLKCLTIISALSGIIREKSAGVAKSIRLLIFFVSDVINLTAIAPPALKPIICIPVLSTPGNSETKSYTARRSTFQTFKSIFPDDSPHPVKLKTAQANPLFASSLARGTYPLSPCTGLLPGMP